MSRFHPWVILLLANVLRVSCSGTGSLTFIIDDTLSMEDEIRQVKESVNEIMDIVFKAKGSRVQEMVLVTINDPGTHLEIKTTDRDDFRRVLNTIKVHNEDVDNDWPEMSMNATLLGLENSHSDSFIYVFTDASPKDYWKKEQVKEMCQRKQSQIVFVITGLYKWFSWYPEYATYYQIAAACSGTVYVCEDKKIPEAIKIIKTKIQNNDTVITTQDCKPNVRTFVKFTVDDHIDTVQIEATGENIIMEVNAPIQTQEKRLWRTHSKVLRLKNPPPRTYTAIVKSKTHAIVTISGTTDIFFKHGFSVLEPKYMANTAPQPFADTKSYLSVSVTDLEHVLNVKSALILTKDEKTVIKTLLLKEISNDFYTTIPFIAPSHQFKVGLIGTTKNTGATIKRIAKIPVTPAKPIKLPDKMKPRVEILEGTYTKIEYTSSVKLTCTVYAYPKPEIKWVNNNGQVVPSKSSLVQDPYKYVSYMQIDNAKEHKTYTCYAVNTEGTTSTSILVHVKDPFEVPTAPKGSTLIKYGSEGVLNCQATSSWPITISWYYADATTGTDRKIETSESYWISNDGTQLKIKKMDTNLVGRYTCKVNLNENQDFTKSFSTRVEVNGLELPKLAEDDQVKAIVGTKVNLYCRVQQGVPAPELTWYFNDKIIGYGNILDLSKIEVNNQGNYRCIAKNSLGEDERITKLIVQVPPKIANDGQSNEVHSVEGADTLKVPCTATGTPSPIITWELASRRISNSDKFTVQNGVLTIKRPQVSDSGDYECVATNEVTSVRTKFRVQVHQKPLLTGLTSIKAIKGTEAKFFCRVLKGIPNPKIIWQLNGNTVGSGVMFIIPAVEEKHRGNYKCVAENAVGKAEHDIELIVLVPPNIRNGGPSTEVRATDGDETLNVPCSASGAPAPVITWELAGRRISNGDKFTIQNGVLTIKRPQVSDSGDYECVATNEVTSVRTKFRVQVNQKPLLTGLTSMKAIVGTKVKLSCRVLKGIPIPKIIWQLNGKTVGSGDMFIIPAVEEKHRGNYKCVAENAVGKAEHDIELIVLVPPNIRNGGPSTEVRATDGDETLNVPCSASGAPAPVITWELAGRRIFNGDKFTIQNGVLTIKRPQVSDSGDYECVATNEVTSVRTKFRVQVHQKPLLTGLTTMKAIKGKQAKLFCRVLKGIPIPKIIWQLNGKTVGSGDMLMISAVEEKHRGNYKCVAENAVGKAEHDIELIVLVPPNLRNGGSSTEVRATDGDETLNVPCSASGAPAPVITWELAGRRISNGDKFTIQNGVLTIKRPQVSDSGDYECVATNEVTSVRTKFRVQVNQKPLLTGLTSMKAIVGTKVKLSCRVLKGIPIPKIIWQLNGKTVGSGDMFIIPAVEEKHRGNYKCVAENAVGKAEHDIELIVLVPPNIRNGGPSTEVRATDGDETLNVPCSASGTPAPVITWELAGRRISNGDKFTIQNGVLTIKRPQVSDSGDYECVATNEVTSVRTKFRVQVNQKPLLTGFTSMKAIIGTEVKLSCRVLKGIPIPKIIWQLNGKTVGSGDMFIIPAVEEKHRGNYKCVAENAVGKAEHDIGLIVLVPPAIVNDGSSTEVRATDGDETLSVPCSANGTPAPVITWELAGRRISNGDKFTIQNGVLTIKHPQVSDSGDYECVATNEVTSVRTKFRIQVNQKPQITGLTSMKAIIGTETNLVCRILKGVPNPKIIWQFNGINVGSGAVFYIPAVKEKHQGNYKCVAENTVGKTEHDIELIVLVPPKIVNGGSSSEVGATDGDETLSIPCSASGAPAPIITWELAGRRISNDDRHTIQNGVLTIKRPQVSDSGDYECVATNEVTSVRSKFRVHVDQKIQLDGEKNIIARVGTSVNIKCNVHRGWPKPNISWFFMDRPLSETKDVLHVDAVKETDAGNYKCVAKNILGKVEHITELIVQYPPRILTNSTVYNVVEDDVALRIPCVVSGVPKPNIKWTWTDNTDHGAVWDKSTDVSTLKKYVTEDGTLVIRNLSRLDADVYKCHATNTIGSVDKIFNVSVTIAPEDFNDTHNVYIKEGESKNISCSSKNFDPASKLTRWFMENLMFSNNTNLLIEDASDSDNGNYTCRVSDINEAVTESYMVRVGKPPTFYAYQEGSLVKWYGDEPLQLDCKPSSGKLDNEIVWKYNGEVLPEATSMTLDAALKWGQYSCNLSNPLGSVQRTFDVTSGVCVMKKTYNESENMPLILGSKHTWPALESWSDYARLNPGEKLTLFCENDKRTSNGFLKFPSESNIIATCVKQDIFKVDGRDYKLSDLGCSKKVTPNIKRKNVKCLTETSELIGVGFGTQSGFVESYEVCFDHGYNIPLYSRARVTKLGRNSSQSWNVIPEFGVTELGDKCDKTSCCYEKTRLTSNEYFEYSTQQAAAFIDPLNSIPYLKDCGSRKSTWLTIDEQLRKRLFAKDFPALIWSGVHTLQKVNGNVIPRYLWKVLVTKKKSTVAIVHINTADPTPEDIKCKVTKLSSVCSNLIDEYTYCCEYADFMVAFGLEHNTGIGQRPSTGKV